LKSVFVCHVFSLSLSLSYFPFLPQRSSFPAVERICNPRDVGTASSLKRLACARCVLAVSTPPCSLVHGVAHVGVLGGADALLLEGRLGHALLPLGHAAEVLFLGQRLLGLGDEQSQRLLLLGDALVLREQARDVVALGLQRLRVDGQLVIQVLVLAIGEPYTRTLLRMRAIRGGGTDNGRCKEDER